MITRQHNIVGIYMVGCFVHAIKCNPLSHDTDTMKPRGEIVKGMKSGPHLHICLNSARNLVDMESRFDFKKEDGLMAHLDDVGNEVDGTRWHASLGKWVVWYDEKTNIGEAQLREDHVEHPIVPGC